MTINHAIGFVVANIRKEKGMSQLDLAFDMGTTRKYLSDIENGKRNISLDVAWRLAEALNISFTELIDCAVNEMEIR